MGSFLRVPRMGFPVFFTLSISARQVALNIRDRNDFFSHRNTSLQVFLKFTMVKDYSHQFFHNPMENKRLSISSIICLSPFIWLALVRICAIPCLP
jgi:hypothetical protein